MSQSKLWLLFFCTLLLSAVSLFWLTTHLFDSLPLSGEYHQTDPDSLLFLRLLEQSILRGEVLQSDNYACYPYEMKHAMAPFYLNFLVHFTWGYLTFFPQSQFDPVYICGSLPILIFWLTGIMIFLVACYLCRDIKLWFFLVFFMLPGSSAVLMSRFLMLDYDYLISLLIWLFVLGGALFLKNRANWLQLAGGLTVALIIATWLGTPLFFFLVTIYGIYLWLVREQNSDDFLMYASSSMLIGSVINLLYVIQSQYAANLFSSQKFSFFQPVCILLGGVFLRAIKNVSAWKNSRILGIISFVVVGLCFVAVFYQPLLQASGILFKNDPLLATINELKTLLNVQSLAIKADSLASLLQYFGWPIFLLPLLVFASSRSVAGHELRFLRDWTIILVCMSIYQVRYLRWLGAGIGLFSGLTAYLLWETCRQNFSETRRSFFRMGLAFFPLLLVFSLQNFSLIANLKGLSDAEVELLTWIGRNTPKTSGYSDKNKPEYSILSYWDEGNLISYYTKRPVAVGNYIWGFKTMADVFSAQSEEEAFSLCEDYGIRYIFIASRENPSSAYDLWNYFKDKPRDPEYQLMAGEIPVCKNYKDWFYFFLSEHLGLKSMAGFTVSSRFRAVYAAKSDPDYAPKYLLFEKVSGAVAVVAADPGSEVVVSLEMTVSGKKLLYKKSEKADEKGSISIRLPYASSSVSGRVLTEAFYKLMCRRNGRLTRFKLFVSESDVKNGTALNMAEKLQQVDEEFIVDEPEKN